MNIREERQMQAVEEIKPMIEHMGYQVQAVKVSVGFLSTGGKGRHLGQCWPTESSAYSINQIFIAPHLLILIEVIDTLVHELVHAEDDCQSGHVENFNRIAKDIGLKSSKRITGARDAIL